MAGKFGNFQIGLDLQPEQMRLLTEEPTPWPGVLGNLLGVAQGFGLRAPGEQRKMQDEIEQYRKKKMIDREFHVDRREAPQTRELANGDRIFDAGGNYDDESLLPGSVPPLPPEPGAVGPGGWPIGQSPSEKAARGEPTGDPDVYWSAKEIAADEAAQGAAPLPLDALQERVAQATGQGIRSGSVGPILRPSGPPGIDIMGGEPRNPFAPPPPRPPGGGMFSPPPAAAGGVAPAPGAPLPMTQPGPMGPSPAAASPYEAAHQGQIAAFDKRLSVLQRQLNAQPPTVTGTQAQFNAAQAAHDRARNTIAREIRDTEEKKAAALVKYADDQLTRASKGGPGVSRVNSLGLIPMIKFGIANLPDDELVQVLGTADLNALDDESLRSFGTEVKKGFERRAATVQESNGRKAAVQGVYNKLDLPYDPKVADKVFGPDWYDPKNFDKEIFKDRLASFENDLARPAVEEKMWNHAGNMFRNAGAAGLYKDWREAATDLAPQRDKSGRITENLKEYENRTDTTVSLRKFKKMNEDSETDFKRAEEARHERLSLSSAGDFGRQVEGTLSEMRKSIESQQRKIEDLYVDAGKAGLKERLDQGGFERDEQGRMKLTKANAAGKTIEDIKIRMRVQVENFNKYIGKVKSELATEMDPVKRKALWESVSGLDLSPMSEVAGEALVENASDALPVAPRKR